MNQGQVASLSAVAQNYAGSVIAADITFSSSNTALAQISSGGLICAGAWDANIITCTPATAAGQVTITATSGGATSTMILYIHKPVDQVVVSSSTACTSMGALVNPTATVYSTSAPGCSAAAPCDITSTVGPISIGSIDPTVAANASGINPTYSSATSTPTYLSGGTITGSAGQTCNLSNFGLNGTLGLDPTFNLKTNSPTYTSGGSVSGSGGQTCTLTSFNTVTGATATVALASTNTILPGAQLTIINQGYGGTTPPTTATLSNGTATCSGTATVSTQLVTVGSASTLTGATATVALTSANTIASGTQLNITNQGYGATTAPNTATLSNGTATCSGTASVSTALNSATGFRAQNPGSTAIFASVSGVNSVGAPFNVCPVVSILVHNSTDSTTNFTLSPTAVQALVADVLDSSGTYIKPTLTWSSNISASASAVAASTGSPGGTVTAVAPGTTTITATCSNPDCNIGVPAQYSLNQATVTVPGSGDTTVYAANTNSTMLVPITTANNTAGTTITLPYVPNSIVADPAGQKIYLGSTSGVMQVDVPTGAVSTAAVAGAVLAVSPDSNYLVISDSAGTVYVFNVASSAVVFAQSAIAPAAAFTADSKTSWFFYNSVAFADSLSAAGVNFPLGYVADDVAFNATGSLAYLSSSAAHQVDVRSTCDHSELQTLGANAPTLLATIPTANAVVAADSPNLDVVTSSNVTGGCPTTATSSLATYDLGVGPFTANQLFVSPDSSKVWLISNLPALVGFNLGTSTAFTVPFANGATPLSGGARPDGQQLYIGANDGTVHRIDVASATDAAQITVGLKDSQRQRGRS